MRDLLERRPSDDFTHLFGRNLELGVDDDSVAYLDAVHFKFVDNILDNQIAVRLIIYIKMLRQYGAIT